MSKYTLQSAHAYLQFISNTINWGQYFWLWSFYIRFNEQKGSCINHTNINILMNMQKKRWEILNNSRFSAGNHHHPQFLALSTYSNLCFLIKCLANNCWHEFLIVFDSWATSYMYSGGVCKYDIFLRLCIPNSISHKKNIF